MIQIIEIFLFERTLSSEPNVQVSDTTGAS